MIVYEKPTPPGMCAVGTCPPGSVVLTPYLEDDRRVLVFRSGGKGRFFLESFDLAEEPRLKEGLVREYRARFGTEPAVLHRLVGERGVALYVVAPPGTTLDAISTGGELGAPYLVGPAAEASDTP